MSARRRDRKFQSRYNILESNCRLAGLRVIQRGVWLDMESPDGRGGAVYKSGNSETCYRLRGNRVNCKEVRAVWIKENRPILGLYQANEIELQRERVLVESKVEVRK